MSAVSDRVVVVGGGVIGAACAYYLRAAGRSVTLIDRSEFGRGCSHGNCGYVCPSHVLPLAGPGALWRIFKTFFVRNSPVRVRWRLDPAMWRWFGQFALKCNERDMIQGGRAIQALLQSSRLLYDELVSSTLKNVEWESPGLLYVFRSPSAMDHYAHVDQFLRREFHLGATRYDRAALLEREPSLKPVSVGAWHYQTDAHLRPDKLMRAWRAALTAQGVEIREHCELRDFLADRRTVRSVITSQGQLSADQIVVATGAWTPRLCRILQNPIAIQPGKGYSLTMPRPARCPRSPMVFEEDRVAITPFASGYRIGSTMEFAGYDTSLNPNRLQLLRDTASFYLHEPLAEPVLESWYGWRPMTPDSMPFLGRLPAFDNVYLAAGHGMLGVSMSPATGRLLAELVCGNTPHIDPEPYAVGRYGH